ncbi:MAG: S-layer homology domain-containing protein [Firmicutes bacterium]|nr:S-layer homology domain-containing protein [Bacillota bacterium]
MKRVSILMSIIMVITMVFGIFAFAGTASFSDVNSSFWAYNYISTVADRGAINGYPDGTFKPQGTITVAEFVKTVVMLANGGQTVAPTTSHWASGYMAAADTLCITRDTVNDKSIFTSKDWDRAITRDEMAKVAVFAEGSVYYYTEGILAKMEEAKATVNFTDLASCSPQVTSACTSGLMTGYGDGTFKPSGTTTRAEASAVIARMVVESLRQYPTAAAVTPAEPVKYDLYGSKYNNAVKMYATGTTSYYLCTDQAYFSLKKADSWNIGHSINFMNSYDIYAVFTDGTIVKGTPKPNNKQRDVSFNYGGFEKVDYYMFMKWATFNYDVWILEAENIK